MGQSGKGTGVWKSTSLKSHQTSKVTGRGHLGRSRKEKTIHLSGMGKPAQQARDRVER